MITENYVSFEIAKLLKKKGFEGIISAYYHIWDNGKVVCSAQEFCHSEAPHLYIPAPTLQITMKWLREVYHLHCDIGYDYILKWYCQITNLEEVVKYDYEEMLQYHPSNDHGFNSYEEACEAAIEYCLVNLI